MPNCHPLHMESQKPQSWSRVRIYPSPTNVEVMALENMSSLYVEPTRETKMPDGQGKHHRMSAVARTRMHVWLNGEDEVGCLHAQHQELAGPSCGCPDDQELQALCKEGQLGRALDRMEQLATPPPNSVYLSLLKLCNKEKTLPHAKRVHAHLALHKLELTGSLGELLVITLVKCGALEDALHIFHQFPCRTAFSWTAVISGFTDQGRGRDALTMYQYMQEEGVEPDHYTFVSLFKACGSIPDLAAGKNLHDKARSKGLVLDVFIGTTLVSMYGKCGAIVEAENVFMGLVSRNVVSWNAMLSAYVDQGHGERALQLYRKMQQEGMTPNPQTILITLQACCTLADKEEPNLDKPNKVMALEIGQALHAYAWKKGFTSDVFVGNTLVSLYGKCGTIAEAENIFGYFSQCGVVSWTALVSTYVEQGQGEKALQSYRQMQEEGISPNQQTFVSALQACGILAENGEDSVFEGKVMSLEIGRALHADAWRKFDALDVFVGTTLVGVYAKSRAVVEAENVFGRLSQCTIVQWNAMLSAYVEQGQGEKALQSYRQVQEEGMCPNQGTFVVALQACGTLIENEDTGDVAEGQLEKLMVHEIGQALHADARRAGFASDVVVGTTLVSMYGKCGTVAEAENVFGGLSQRSTISWNAMLSAYVDQGQGEKALQLYKHLQNEHVILNDVTLVCVLQACSETGCMEICRQLHFTTISAAQDSRVFVTSTLIHAYGSCASMVDAYAVFDGLSKPAVAAWNACIAGYAGEGDCVATLQMFEEMQLTCNHPAGATFASLLSACSHAGLVDKGIEYFESMSKGYGTKPDLKHYVSMVDLLGRSGDLKTVGNILKRIPVQVDLSIWLCLLGACRAHSNVKLGKVAFDHAVSLQPKEAAPYVLMSNIYADAWLQ